jgi:peptide chain release factor 2
LNDQLKTFEELTHRPNFWNDQQEAQRVSRAIGALRDKLDQDAELVRLAGELQTYIDLLAEEPNEALFAEALDEWKRIVESADRTETRFLLNDKFDEGDAILTIHPGAGGTESQDWAEMLLRMYKRWAEKNKYGFEIVDYLPGEEAGLKSVTAEVSGRLAYGYLKAEKGIHRLVRMSPFNAQGKRQTSFASIFVYPVIDDEIEVEINPKDLKIDTYRSSSAGGQHVNVTDSAVRITHLPTNIVASCQNERSQIKNRATAMKILRSRLLQHYEEERDKERQKTENEKTEIGWGNQIRSYVFHPYQMVKDHRTDFEVGNTALVMDGGLDGFMTAYLKQQALRKKV